jgi:hypothetical protein
VVDELLHMRILDESTSYRSKGDIEKNALPTFERCTVSVVKVIYIFIFFHGGKK